MAVRSTAILCAIIVLMLGALLLAGSGVQADSVWATPVNLSNSGAASQAVAAAAPDGTLHVLWWDAYEGTLYARMPMTATAKPVSVPQIVGARTLDQKTSQMTSQTAPRDLRVLADARGALYAFWYTTDGQLMAAQAAAATWTQAVTLTTSALVLDIVGDATSGAHTAYISAGGPSLPAGIYYQKHDGSVWGDPMLVYASPYVRRLKAEDAHISMAVGKQGVIVIAWDDPLLDQNVIAVSSDGGATWSAPQVIAGRQVGQTTMRIQHAHVAASGNGDVLLLWQDTASSGCGLAQRRSSDGGQTWAAPERVLTDLNRCPGRWQFSVAGDGRLWLVGSPLASTDDTGQSGILAAWDGRVWSEASDVSVSSAGAATGRSVTLQGLALALAGQTVGVVGTDDKGDVWATVNAIPLEQLVPALTPVWSAPQTLSDGNGQAELPAIAADAQGRIYTMWSQQAGTANSGASLYVAAWDGTRWGRALQVFTTVANPAVLEPDAQMRAEQPALAVDTRGRLHAVWSGGVSGRIMYSWVFGREAASQSWAAAEALPGPSGVAAWPDIVADPRGDVLHVAYAVPYNEQRGVYYLRSQAQGEAATAVWLTPTVIFDAVAAGWDSVSKVRLALDATEGTLHAVWLQSGLPGGAARQAVYYARSTDDGRTWSSAQKVIEGTVDWPRVVVAGKQVHLLWNKVRADGSAELWAQYSTDGGARWSQAAAVRGFDRLSGPATAAADGAGALFVSGVSQGTSGESVLLSTRWDGAQWAKADSMGLGQSAAAGNAAAIALSGKGDRLSVAVRRFTLGQDGVGQFAIAASERAVQAAAVAPAPTFTPLPSPTPAPTRTPQATATPVRQFPMPDSTSAPSSDPISIRLPVVLGGSLGIVLVLGVVVTRALFWNRKR